MPSSDSAGGPRPRPSPGYGVEPGGGLVEEEDLRDVDQSGGQVEPALHAARVGADATIDGVTDVDQIEDVVERRRSGAGLSP